MKVARTIVTGDFHPALEDALLDHLAERLAEASISPLEVVVPTNYLGLRVSHLLAERVCGHANVRFMTLRDLARRTVPPPLPGGRSLLPSRADAVIVRRLLDEGEASGGYFASIAERPGLSVAILSAIRDLKESSYDPRSFEKAAGAQGLLRRSRRNKFAELSRLWRAYEARLESDRWADDSDLMRAAAETLEAGGGDPTALVVYGFYDLNALQKRLLAAHIERSGATVFFPYCDIDACSFAVPTLEWFLSLGFTRTELESDTRAVPLPAETLILSAPGEAREAREIVRALVPILEHRGAVAQDVAVLMRSPDTYSDLFAEEFGRLMDGGAPGAATRRGHGYVESPPPLSRTRSGRSLLKLALATQADFARADVLEFLSLAELSAEVLGTGGAAVGDWSAVSRLAGIAGGADGWSDGLRRLAERIAVGGPDDDFAERHGRLAESAVRLERVMQRLLGALSPVPARETVSAYLDRLCAAFRGVTAEGAERERVLAAVDKMREVSPVAGRVSLAYFVELLRQYLDVPPKREVRFGVGGPSILGVMSARGLSYRVVVLPGLVEKGFPLRHRQDPILLDADRERLNAAQGGDPLRELPRSAEGADEERLLFRLAVHAGRELVVLTYPRLDPATARPRLPSAFVLDALREITGRPHDYEALDVSEHVTRIPLSRRFPEDRMDALTRDEFDGRSILQAIGTGRPETIAYLLRNDGPLRPRLEMEETRWTNPFFTRYDGVLSSEESLEAARALSGFTAAGPRPDQILSATTLEEYATCPFRFLMHRVLKIDPVEEPEDVLELSPLDRGSLYHAVLERFLKRMRSQGRLPLRPDSRDDLLEIAESLTRSGSWGLSGHAGARLMEFRALARNLTIWLHAELAEPGDFVPAYFEARFGGVVRQHDDAELSTEASVHYDVGDGPGIAFGGKIDRIDVSADGARARVIDYKTGRQAKRSPVLEGGRRLQLPVYLIASRAMLEGKHPVPSVESAEYRYVTAGPGAGPLLLTAAEVDERASDLRTALSLIIEGITSGMFFLYPLDPKCRNCDYSGACGSTALKLAAMKSGDGRAGFFTQQLTEIT